MIERLDFLSSKFYYLSCKFILLTNFQKFRFMKRQHSYLIYAISLMSVAIVILLIMIVSASSGVKQAKLPPILSTSLRGMTHSESVDNYRKNYMKRLEDNLYFDYAGENLYTDLQVRSFIDELHKNLYGNTHSESPSAKLSSELVLDMREYIREYFGIEKATEYIVVFTYSHAQALKLIAEAFQFNQNSTFLYSTTSSNNILGLRGFATEKGAKAQSFDIKSDAKFEFAPNSSNLIAFPLVDEFDGSTLSVTKMQKIIKAANASNAATLVDASIYLANHKIDLKETPFKAVAVSFDKMFGYPTLGAVLIEGEFIKSLKKPYFGGGTLVFALPHENYEKMRLRPAEKFEDGSLPFLSIAALKNGFKLFDDLDFKQMTSGIRESFHRLYKGLKDLKNVKLYTDSTSETIVTFNILDKDQNIIDYNKVLAAAAAKNITLTGGCMNTPGTCTKLLGKTDSDLKKGGFGALRASVGWATSFNDIDGLVSFVKNYQAND